MIRFEVERMGAPPAGTIQAPGVGDAPLNAKDDFPTPPGTVFIVCCLQGDWPGATPELRRRCPDLGAHYVRCLYEMVTRHAPPGLAWRFVCFTDRQSIEGVNCRALAPGLWSYFCKLYLFAPGHFPVGSRVLYFDLDTCITGSWAPLLTVAPSPIVMLRDLWAERKPASGVMMWTPTAATEAIWLDFVSNTGLRPPYSHPRPRERYAAQDDIRTDEQWLYHYTLPTDWQAWQEQLPGVFASYKYDVTRSMRRDGTQGERLTEEAARAIRVLYFHGQPRPHMVRAPWNPISRGLIE